MLKISPHTFGWFVIIGALTSLAVVVLRGRRGTRGLPLPPGPQGLPLVGNIFQIPSEKPWKVYKEWGKVYGDIIYLEALGQTLLVLNNLEDCLALLEKRGVNYSDRAQSMGSKLSVSCLSVWAWGFDDYGPRLKEYRRVFHQLLGPKQVPQYRPVMEEEVHLFLQQLLSTPDDFAEHVRGLFGSIIIRTAYGSSDVELNKAQIATMEKLADGFLALLRPGRLLVDFFPVLRFVPAWFPGAGWKREIDKVRALAYQVANVSYDAAKERLNSGQGTAGYPSIVQQYLASIDPGLNEKERQEREEVGRFTASVAFQAGADTSIAAGLGLFGALAMHPEVQLKAHAEIGRVVGHDRLPHLNDLEQLPYIKAILKELARWHVVTPFTVPHLSREDDEYKGYFIPKGTVILPNAWAILNNPKVFVNPRQFNPERYLDQDGNIDTNVPDPDIAAFGYGRRICPGRHLSLEVTALMIASLLAVFEVKPPTDESGKEMSFEMDTVSEITAKPLPFQCQIVPRSEKHASLLD
ncbi:cytochrome P450 98A3 [Coprinopsis sp. MPI-PUGE-AT-0042]|nr:cytochrome P450 98A3 [Coprinopsis sp. MPI-PUGE-AT-0042]